LNRIRAGLVSSVWVLLLFGAVFGVVLNVPLASGQLGIIYIRADGSVDPPTAPIQRAGDVYTLTGNIYENIVIERSNMTLDGAAYTIQGAGQDGGGLHCRGDTTAKNNITIKNMKIEAAWTAIDLFNCSDSRIYGNNITNNYNGIELYGQSNNIFGNNITNNTYIGVGVGITLSGSNNNITGNNITNNDWGLRVSGSLNILSGNVIDGNKYNLGVEGDLGSHSIDTSNLVNGKPVYYLVNQKNLVINAATHSQAGYLALISCTNISVEGQELTNNGQGLLLVNTNNSRITNNDISSNNGGVYLRNSSNNIIQGSTVKDNYDGVMLRDSSNNVIKANNITSNHMGVTVLRDSSNNTITRNNVKNNTVRGIVLYEGSSHSTVTGNSIRNNVCGVFFDTNTMDNILYHNNFINNTEHVSSPYRVHTWDNGYPSGGNYWNDYTGVDTNGDGIGDTPYVINSGNQDRYPLMSPWAPPQHELVTSITAPATLRLGSSSSLNAIVANEGLYDEINVELSLLINDNVVDSTTIPLLQASNPHTLSYLWTPTAEGAYNVTAYALPAPGEASLENNQKTKIVTVAVSPPPGSKVGVMAGDWIKIDYTIYGAPSGSPSPRWLKVEFLSVEGTAATVRVTMHMSDGSEQNATMPIDAVAGGQALGLSGFLIPANCTTDDCIYMTGYGNVTIEGETTRTYAGASRTVVYASFSQLGTQVTYYWDKQTGVMVEASTTSGSITATGKATETNMWQADSSPFWVQWWFYALVAAIVVALAGTIFFLKKRKPSTPTAPKLPTEST